MKNNKCSNLSSAKYRALAFVLCLEIIFFFFILDVGVGKYRHVTEGAGTASSEPLLPS